MSDVSSRSSPLCHGNSRDDWQLAHDQLKKEGRTQVHLGAGTAPPNPPGPLVDTWPMDPVAFGTAVRKAREAAGLTRSAFAVQFGISDATLRNIEMARHRCTFRVRTLLVLALAHLKRAAGC
jgi:ribosome-binding protein aMBF1 (putative translation factor)